MTVAMLRHVEVEARHACLGIGLPRAVGEAGECEAGRRHPALLGARNDDVEGPGILLEGHRPDSRDAVDEDERLGRGFACHRGELGQRIHHASRRLVVGDEDRLVAAGGRLAEGVAKGLWSQGRAPLDVELGDLGAVGLRDLREAVAKRADADAEDLVAWREGIDDRRLEAAGAGAAQENDVVPRAEKRLDPPGDALEHRREFRTPVVDHLPRAGLTDRRGQAGGAWNPEVGLEAVHAVSWLGGRLDESAIVGAAGWYPGQGDSGGEPRIRTLRAAHESWAFRASRSGSFDENGGRPLALVSGTVRDPLCGRRSRSRPQSSPEGGARCRRPAFRCGRASSGSPRESA